MSNGGWGRNVVIFGVDNTSSMHADNRKKDILVLGQGLTNVLDDTVTTAGSNCSINITEFENKSTLQWN